MGRFAPVYTDEQKAAIKRAGLEDEHTAANVVRMAAAGELYGLEPFTVPLSTAADYIRRERRKREGREPRAIRELEGKRAADQLRRRVLVAADAMLERAEKKLHAGKLEPAAFETVTRTVLKIAKELETLPAPNQGGVAPKAEPGNGNGQREPDILERLAKEARKQ